MMLGHMTGQSSRHVLDQAAETRRVAPLPVRNRPCPRVPGKAGHVAQISCSTTSDQPARVLMAAMKQNERLVVACCGSQAR